MQELQEIEEAAGIHGYSASQGGSGESRQEDY